MQSDQCGLRLVQFYLIFHFFTLILVPPQLKIFVEPKNGQVTALLFFSSSHPAMTFERVSVNFSSQRALWQRPPQLHEGINSQMPEAYFKVAATRTNSQGNIFCLSSSLYYLRLKQKENLRRQILYLFSVLSYTALTISTDSNAKIESGATGYLFSLLTLSCNLFGFILNTRFKWRTYPCLFLVQLYFCSGSICSKECNFHNGNTNNVTSFYSVHQTIR